MHAIWITSKYRVKKVKKCVPETFDFPNWSGSQLTVTFDLTKYPYLVIVGADILMKTEDYTITGTDKINFIDPVVELNVQIVKLCGGVSSEVLNVNLGKFKNDEEALIGMTNAPLINQSIYRLTADNDYAMAENTVRFLERP